MPATIPKILMLTTVTLLLAESVASGWRTPTGTAVAQPKSVESRAQRTTAIDPAELGETQEVTSRSYTVANSAKPPVAFDEAISRTYTVRNFVSVVHMFHEKISRSVSVCNRTGAPDTDGDGVNDCDDICPGFPDSDDRDLDGIPDDCDNCPDHRNPDQADCDSDDEGDVCEIAFGAPDCTRNGIPDVCEPDCDGNGIADSCDIAACPDGVIGCDDCNLNGVRDSCETEDGSRPQECINWLADKPLPWSTAGLDVWDTVDGSPPNNNGEDSFSVSVGGGVADVALDIDVTIDSLDLANGARLRVSGESVGDLTVVTPGGMTNSGIMEVGGARSVTISSGPLLLHSGGSYQPSGPSSSTLTAASISLRWCPDPCVPAAMMVLADQMSAIVMGDFSMISVAAPCGCDSANSSRVVGAHTPPILKAIQSAVLDVRSDFHITGTAQIEYSSDQPMSLGGSLLNTSTHPECFDWASGGISVHQSTTVAPNTIEAAGADRRRSLSGLENNFAFGLLELGNDTELSIIDLSDNQLDGATPCEAMYCRTLRLQEGSAIHAQGCPLYFVYLEDLRGGDPLEGLPAFVQSIATMDNDGDRDIDANDFAGFVVCLGEAKPGPTCLTVFDVNNSGTIDLADFVDLQNFFLSPFP